MNVEEMVDEFLVCPKCQGSLKLILSNEKEILICKACNVYYPVEDEIPILLIEEAKNISEISLDLNDLVK